MNEGDQVNWIRNLKMVGMNTVEATVYAHQGRWHENNLWYPTENAGLVEEIRLAKKAGMNVVLILRLQLDHAFEDNKFKWHGMVFPRTEYLLNRWFEEYTKFVKTWALIAEEEDVDVLVLGSEMNSMFETRITEEYPPLQTYFLSERKQADYRRKMMHFEEKIPRELLVTHEVPQYENLKAWLDEREENKVSWSKITGFVDSTDQTLAVNQRRVTINYYWEKLIWDTRAAYKGKLTIAANFDNYHEVDFWDQLDFIGINAYFPLRNWQDGGDQMSLFKESWEEVLDSILAFRERAEVTHLPILFTELGYAKHAGCSVAPWQGEGFSLIEEPGFDTLIVWSKQPTDYAERNNAVRALYEVVKEKDFPLAGILYWKFTSKESQLQYDPFALHIGTASQDTMQSLLLRFKDLGQKEQKQKGSTEP